MNKFSSSVHCAGMCIWLQNSPVMFVNFVHIIFYRICTLTCLMRLPQEHTPLYIRFDLVCGSCSCALTAPEAAQVCILASSHLPLSWSLPCPQTPLLWNINMGKNQWCMREPGTRLFWSRLNVYDPYYACPTHYFSTRQGRGLCMYRRETLTWEHTCSYINPNI